MKNRRLSYTAICSCILLMSSLTACEEIGGENAVSADNSVVLEISVPRYSADWDEGTRALKPLDDQLQKQIHNLWYYFYNEDQNLTYVFHQDIVSTTIHRVEFEDFIEAAEYRGVEFSHHDGYLFIVANSENIDNNLEGEEVKPKIILEQADRPTGNYDEWRRTIANVDGFKKNSLMPLYISGRADTDTSQPDDASVGLPGHLMLYGSFHGLFHDHNSAETGHTMSIVLGRTVARLRIALSGAGLGEQARITIQNAPIVTTLFPDVQPLYADNEGAQDCWMNYMEMVSVSEGSIVETGGSRTSSTYYYCGENSTHEYPIKSPGTFGDKDEYGNYTGKVSTTLIVETWDEYNEGNTVTKGNGTTDPTKNDAVKPDRTYKVVLGHDIPRSSSSSSTAGTPRDLNLYRNTSYTFRINLMTESAPASYSSAGTKSAVQNEDRQINVWPVEVKE